MTRHRRLGPKTWSAACATLCFVVPALGTPKCAVVASADLGPEGSLLLDLVEVQLTNSTDLDVLSRTDLTPVLAERALVLAMSSERESRRASGPLLHVDVLAILNAQRTDAGDVLELSVIETKHGLRLTHDRLVWGKDVEKLADLISHCVHLAARRIERPLRWVFGVPPFDSGDLGFDAYALKRTYAELTEQAIADVEGTVVVDLENADEIARELALSDGEAVVSRPLPYYVLGWYESHGLGADRHVDLELKLRRGSDILATERRAGLTTSQVAAFLRNSVRNMLRTHLDAAAVLDSEDHLALEADLLEEEARASRMQGDWARAIRMASATLLLDPTRKDLHFMIFRGCGVLMGRDLNLAYDVARHKDTSKKAPEYADHKPSPRERRAYALLGLEHLEQYVRSVQLGVAELDELRTYWFGAEVSYYNWNEDYFGIAGVQREIGRAKLRIPLYVLKNDRLKPRASNLTVWETKGLWHAASLARYDRFNTLFTVDEKLDAILAVLLALSEHEGSFNAQCDLLASTFPCASSSTTTKAYDRFLSALSHAKSPETRLLPRYAKAIMNFRGESDLGEARAVVEDIKKQIFPEFHDSPDVHWFMDGQLDVKYKKLTGTLTKPERTAGTVEPSIQFTQIELITTQDKLYKASDRWLPLDNGTDVLFYYDRLHLMRRRGILVPIESPDGMKWWLSDVVWDGRYLWLARIRDANEICVLDPETGVFVARFRGEDGLPSTKYHCRLAPLSPGKICAIGFFGRTWIANLTLESDDQERIRKTIDLFYTAREPYDRDALEDEFGDNFELAFSPTFVVPFVNSDPTDTVLLVGRNLRWGHHVPDRQDAIIVAPFARRVRPFPASLTFPRKVVPFGTVVPAGNVALWSTWGRYYEAMAPCLIPNEIEFTGGKGTERPFYGYPIVHDDFLHTVNEQWTTVDLQTREFVLFEDLSEPQLRGRPAYSNHFGLILRGLRDVWQVHLPPQARRNR